MSMDYPFYQELLRRKHPAAWWWRVGDVLYYLGLMPAVMALAVAALSLVAGLSQAGMVYAGWTDFQFPRPLQHPWANVFAGLVLFAICAATYFVGRWMKSRSYMLAERDGISLEAALGSPPISSDEPSRSPDQTLDSQ